MDSSGTLGIRLSGLVELEESLFLLSPLLLGQGGTGKYLQSAPAGPGHLF